MKKHLIIVESPSKIKTLNKFLNDKYIVEASVGHIRDLPKSKLGIDVENDFSAEYHVSPNSTKTVQTLKKALKNAGFVDVWRNFAWTKGQKADGQVVQAVNSRKPGVVD